MSHVIDEDKLLERQLELSCRRESSSSEKMSAMERECRCEKRRIAMLRQCSEMLRRDGTSRYSRDAFKTLFHNEVFLEKLFALFNPDKSGLLKQDEWIEFLKGRLTNEKQNDFVDQIESVAYVLCGDEPVNLTTFRQIFHTKGIKEKLFKLIDLECTASVTPEQIMEFIASISNPRARIGFDERNLEWLEKIFKQTVGNEKEICREEFKKIVTSKNPFFTERVFQIFDKDSSGTISLQEFLDAMHEFAGKTTDDKIKFLFKVYDIDGDGLIQLRELEHVLRACMEENGMSFSDEQIEDLTVALFEDADQGSRGAITFDALKRQLEKHGGLLENLTISIDRWLVPPKPEERVKKSYQKFPPQLPYQFTKPYLKNNYVKLTFISCFIFVNFALFVSRAYEYRHNNGLVIIARACGQCLNFNCTFILILMLRQCITFLRTHGFSSVLPLDNHIYLHKMTGGLICIFSLVHTVMHLINVGMYASDTYTMSEWIFSSKPHTFGLVPGCANPTGVFLLLILAIMTVCSMPFVRRGGCFEIFYWSHLLYVPFWFLMIFHGPNFWKWFIVPGLIYLIERIRRLVWLHAQRGKTYISSGLLLPSKVTHLVIKRPSNFVFRPGDYVFVNIPVIAKYEWHPFTVSSAPEQEEYMWLHIRAVGEWTNSLYSYFEKEQQKLHRGDVIPVENCTVKKTPCSVVKSIPALMEKKLSVDSLEDPRGLVNPVFVPDDAKTAASNPTLSSPGSFATASESNVTPENRLPSRRLHPLASTHKMPLEKSLSMPDMQTKTKKRQRMQVLRDYMRSESEKSFDECSIRRARLKSLGLAYLSPQNKSLAQSFRYMRTKPTIIAFKTPSLENCEYELPSSASKSTVNDDDDDDNDQRVVIQISPVSTPEKKSERAAGAKIRKASCFKGVKCEVSCHVPLNYPVGKPLEIYLDGPYGAPSSHIFQAQHAVLIATGIGVTPFASILQSIMHRYWKARHSCPKCSFEWASEIPASVMKLRKVDFFWINRDQRSFEWFVNLLSQLEMEQAELGATMERFLEMHMYITSALQKSDMKAVGLQLALDLLHEKEKRDLITGLKTRTNAGRPNWDKVFKQLQDQKKGKVTIFYCGPPQLARILRYKCDQFGFNFRKESF